MFGGGVGQATIAELKRKAAEKEAEMAEVWKEVDTVKVEAARAQDAAHDLQALLEQSRVRDVSTLITSFACERALPCASCLLPIST